MPDDIERWIAVLIFIGFILIIIGSVISSEKDE